VPLSPGLVRELRRHLAELPPGSPDSLAFPNRNGGALDISNTRRILQPAFEEAGAGAVGFHVFRHGYASMLLASGVNIVTASKLLGHSNPAVTLGVYAHVLPSDEMPALDLEAELRTCEQDANTRGLPSSPVPSDISADQARMTDSTVLSGIER
jgi:integrase